MASHLNQPLCTPPPQTCWVIAVPNQRQSAVKYAQEHKCTFLGLALTQVILGVFCLGLGISSLPICTDDYYDYDYYYCGLTMVSTGIWGGVSVIIFGSFGLAQICSPSLCKVTTNLTLSIFGIFIALTMVWMEITAAIFSYHNDGHSGGLVVIHSLEATFSFILFILFIVSTSYAGAAKCSGCCGGCCCEDNSQQQMIMNGTPSQLITLPNGQMVVVKGASQGNPQVVASPPVVNPLPQYSLAAPAGQQNFSVVPGPSNGLANQGFQTDVPNGLKVEASSEQENLICI